MTQKRLKAKSLLARNSARLALAGISLTAPSLFAATGIWNGTAGGGDGFWDATANTEWSGLTGNAWDATNGPNNIAQFNSGAAGSNPGTSGTPVANGIIWNGVGGGISSGAGVKLDGTNPFINVNTSGQTSQLSANLLGTNGFTKTGVGQLTLLDSLKSITGGITVSQGSLRLSLVASGNVVNSSNTLNLSGSQLEVFGNGTQTLSDFTLGNGGSRIVLSPNGASNSTTLSLANWTKASNSSVVFDYTATGTAKTLTLSGTLPTVTNSLIGGYATVRDTSTTYGFATLDGSNNVVRYTGATVVSSALGANTASATNYKATTAGTWFNGSGTSQTLNSLEIAIAGTVSGNNSATYILNSGGLLFSDTSNTTNGGQANMTFTSATSELHIATMQYNSGFAVPSVRGVTDNGGISVILIKDGTGGLSMATGTFFYTGDTIVNDGILYNPLNIPSGTGKGNLVVNSRGIVTIGVSTSGTRTINGLSNTTLGGGTVNNQNFTSTAASSFLDLGNNNATASFSGTITGNFGIIKSGTGTQTFSGNNNYTGTTQVNAGTLRFTKTASLYNNTSANWTAANINVKNGATLAINVGGTGEFTTGNVTTLLTNLAASSSGTNGMNAGSSLGFDTTNASGGTFTISDVIADTTGASGGTRGLTKLGTGTLTLPCTNSYTGPTAVKAGTLEVSGSLSATTSVSVTGGTLLLSGAAGEQVNNAAAVALGGGTLGFNNAANQIETLGALTLSANSTIDFGASGGNDTLAFSGLTSHTAGTTLTIQNWVGNSAGGITGTNDRLLFSGSYTNFTSAFNQADVSFTGFGTGYSAINFGGTSYEIVPVPEPSTLLGAIGLLGLIGLRERRLLSALRILIATICPEIMT